MVESTLTHLWLNLKQHIIGLNHNNHQVGFQIVVQIIHALCRRQTLERTNCRKSARRNITIISLKVHYRIYNLTCTATFSEYISPSNSISPSNEQNRTVKRVVVGAVGFFSDYPRVTVELALTNWLSDHRG